MPQDLDPDVLAADLGAVRSRIDRIAAAILDAELQGRLTLLREQVAAAAASLRQPTAANLAGVAERVRSVTKQIDVLTRRPEPKPRSAPQLAP